MHFISNSSCSIIVWYTLISCLEILVCDSLIWTTPPSSWNFVSRLNIPYYKSFFLSSENVIWLVGEKQFNKKYLCQQPQCLWENPYIIRGVISYEEFYGLQNQPFLSHWFHLVKKRIWKITPPIRQSLWISGCIDINTP